MKTFTIILLFLLFTYNAAFARNDLKVSLPIVPPLIISKDEGLAIDLIKEMAKEYKDGKIEIIGVFPFKRSVQNIVERKADFHFPYIKNEITPKSELNFIYSSVTLFPAQFVLYVNKDIKGINVNTMHKYRICTNRAHEDYFRFKVLPINNIENALRMVSSRRQDGFIFPYIPTDKVLKASGIKNIKRLKGKVFQAKIILPRTERGEEVDNILTRLIGSLKKKGIYQKIMTSELNTDVFIDWQVY